MSNISKEDANHTMEPSIYFEGVISLMPGHVYWKDLKGNYLGCNEAQAKSLGLKSRNDIKKIKPYEKLAPYEVERLKRIDNTVIKKKITVTNEEPGIREDGVPGVFLTKKAPLVNDKNEVIGLLGISFDITAQKSLEKQNIEKEMLEKQVKLSEVIAATVAHEVRTPLACIQATATCIQMFLKKNNTKLAGQLCDKIKVHLKRTNNFIEMFLMNLKSINDEKATSSEIKTTIIAAVKEYAYVDISDCNLIKVSDELLNFSYTCNQTVMKHLFFNLIKNSLFFIKKEGRGSIEIYTDSDPNFNYLYFKDTAMGIPEDKINLIFDKFYTITDVGTGVGLSFCKMVMTSMKGNITCESKFGEYTTFKLWFPKL